MREEIVKGIVERVREGRVLRNESLSDHTTMAVGGPAAVMVEPFSEEELSLVASYLYENDYPFKVLGAGSNIIVSDTGLDEVVLLLNDNLSNIEVDIVEETVRAQAGAMNKDLAQLACEAGLAGYEFASGIPGTVGGAAYMNAGAYGGEFSEVVKSLRCINEKGEVVELTPGKEEWGYRHSPLTDSGYIVVEVCLQLHSGKKEDIQAQMDELRGKREAKQPLEMASAGSTFKRPVGYFAGKLIQDAGLQGYCVGGAQVSNKHAGFVVNIGSASAADVCGLIAHVQGVVKEKFGVELEPEPRMWGF